MGLTDMKAFYRWLEESSSEELEKKKTELVILLPKLHQNGSTLHNAQRLISKIEEEMLSRAMK